MKFSVSVHCCWLMGFVNAVTIIPSWFQTSNELGMVYSSTIIVRKYSQRYT